MARFVQKTAQKNVTVNKEGAKAYKLTPFDELYTLVCTSILSDKYYTKASDDVERIRELVKKVKPIDVARLAIYARNEMYLRTIPLVLTVELAKVHSGDSIVSRMIPKVVRRADEIAELLAYYAMANGRKGTKRLDKLSKQVQKGLADAFLNFDEYGFAKYNRDQDVKLRDAMFLVHPKPTTDEQAMLFKKIAEDTLEVPYTWEVELSKLGQASYETPADKLAAKKAKWEELIDSGKLGYMALMRNLRNMLDVGVSKAHMEKVASILRDPARVARSKQLPFRFYNAYKVLKDNGHPSVSIFLEALNDAIWESVKNVDCIDDNDTVMVAFDSSGSMTWDMNTSTQLWEVGALLAVLLRKKCKSVTLGLFDTNLQIKQIPQNANVLDAVQSLAQYVRAGATNGYLVPEYMNAHAEYDYNKCFMFTDMQLWSTENRSYSGWGHDSRLPGEWEKYHKNHPDASLILADLAGHGTSPISLMRDKGVYLVAGWSDKIFKMIKALNDGSTVKAEIDKIEV